MLSPDTAELSSIPAVAIPHWLEQAVRVLLYGAFMVVLCIPLLAAFFLLLNTNAPLDSGANTILVRTMLHCMILFSAALLLMLPQASLPGRRQVHTALLALLVAWGVAAFLSVSPSDSLMQWSELFMSVCLLLVAREVCATESAFCVVVHVMLFIGSVLALVGLGMYTLGANPEAAVTGTFYQADVAAGYFLMVLPLGLSLLVGARRLPQRILYVMVTLLCGTALLLTYSRGGQLAIMATVAFALVPCWVWQLRRLGFQLWECCLQAVAIPLIAFMSSVVLAGAISGFGHAQLVPERAVRRTAELVSSGDSSVVARVAFWKGALRMYLARPLAGWGPGTFGRIFPRFQKDARWYSKFVHSQYLAFVAEGGTLMLGAICLCAWAMGRAYLRTLCAVTASDDDPAGFLPLELNSFALSGVVGGVLAVALHIAVDVDWEFPALMATSFALAGMALEPKVTSRPPAYFTQSSMRWQWMATIPLMALVLLQPLPYIASQHWELAGRFRRVRPADGLGEMRAAARTMPFSSQYHRELAELLLDVSGATKPRQAALDREALDHALRSVGLDPDRAVNQEVLARCYSYVGDREQFQLALQRAIACDPINYPGFYNLQADMLMLDKKLDEARRMYMIPASTFPPDVEKDMWFFRRNALHPQMLHTYLSLAKLAEDSNQLDRARKYYQLAVEEEPTSILARFSLGSLNMRMSDPGSAFTQFRQINLMKPDHPLSMWLLGLAYQAMGEHARTESLWQKAFKLDPELRYAGKKGHVMHVSPDFYVVTPPSPAPSNPVEGNAR